MRLVWKLDYLVIFSLVWSFEDKYGGFQMGRRKKKGLRRSWRFKKVTNEISGLITKITKTDFQFPNSNIVRQIHSSRRCCSIAQVRWSFYASEWRAIVSSKPIALILSVFRCRSTIVVYSITLACKFYIKFRISSLCSFPWCLLLLACANSVMTSSSFSLLTALD